MSKQRFNTFDGKQGIIRTEADILSQLSSKEGQEYTKNVERFCDIWVPRTVTKNYNRFIDPYAGAVILLREIFCESWFACHRVSGSELSEFYDELSGSLSIAVRKLSVPNNNIDSILWDHEELIENKQYLNALAALAGKEYKNDPLVGRGLLLRIYIPAIKALSSWSSIEQKKHQTPRAVGPPGKPSRKIIIKGLLKYLYTVQEVKPTIPGVKTLNLQFSKKMRYKKLADNMKRYFFIVEGLKVAGLDEGAAGLDYKIDNFTKKNKKNIVKPINDEINNIDWSAEEAVLKVPIIVDESYYQ